MIKNNSWYNKLITWLLGVGFMLMCGLVYYSIMWVLDRLTHPDAITEDYIRGYNAGYDDAKAGKERAELEVREWQWESSDDKNP